jgi:hypothetical protein
MVHVEEVRVSAQGSGYGWDLPQAGSERSWITAVIHGQLVRIRYHVVAQYISPMAESWSRRAS